MAALVLVPMPAGLLAGLVAIVNLIALRALQLFHAHVAAIVARVEGLLSVDRCLPGISVSQHLEGVADEIFAQI